LIESAQDQWHLPASFVWRDLATPVDDSPSLLTQPEASSYSWGTAASTNVKIFDYLCDGEGFSGQDQSSESATHSSIDLRLPNSHKLDTTHQGTIISDLGSRSNHRNFQPVLFGKQCYVDLPSGLKEDLCYSCMIGGPERLDSEFAALFDDPACNTAVDMSFVDPQTTHETARYRSIGDPLTDLSQVGELEGKSLDPNLDLSLPLFGQVFGYDSMPHARDSSTQQFDADQSAWPDGSNVPAFDPQSLLLEEPLQPLDNVASFGVQGDSFARKGFPVSIGIKSRSHARGTPREPLSAARREKGVQIRAAGACLSCWMMKPRVVLDTINLVFNSLTDKPVLTPQ
jgi:hypothetical protein